MQNQHQEPLQAILFARGIFAAFLHRLLRVRLQEGWKTFLRLFRKSSQRLKKRDGEKGGRGRKKGVPFPTATFSWSAHFSIHPDAAQAFSGTFLGRRRRSSLAPKTAQEKRKKVQKRVADTYK